MIKIQVDYHVQSNTFIANDGYGNQITFKSDRESNEAIPISSTSTAGPMTTLIMACGACSGIDIVMILGKQREIFDKLSVIVWAEREQEKTPALWKKVKIDYYLDGNFDRNKAQKAAELSVDKYCSVLETLRRAGAEVSFEVFVNQSN